MINEITKDIIYIVEREIKGSGQFLFVFLEKPLYEVCLIQIKEQVGEKRSTVCTHRHADCLLENTSTKDNKYVVNQKLDDGYSKSASCALN